MSHEQRPSLTPGFPLAYKQTSRVMTSLPPTFPHRGWHSRGYLPHWDYPGAVQSLNFRLCDAMPAILLEQWKIELQLRPGESDSVEFRRRVEHYLDSGCGECWLRRPEIARIVEGALFHFDKQRYRLLAWCIMPNHVHVLIEVFRGFPMAGVLQSWKSFTSHRANLLLCRKGAFWQREYFDRYVRNVEHYLEVIAYIEENPLKAGLTKVRSEWPWSSARFRVPGSAGVSPAS